MTRFAALMMVSALCISAAAQAADGVIAKRGYIDNRFGQIHYHSFAPADGKSKKTPIAFFHQNPRSAEDMQPLTSELGKDRLVLAFDTPGYGNSDRPKEPPDMANLAGAMSDALSNLGYGKGKKNGQVDVFGFHTGAFIAAELSVQRPDLVRRVVLSGIAFYTPEVRQQRLAAMARNEVIPEDASMVVRQWYNTVNIRTPGIPIERAAAVFLDQLRSLNKGWYASFAVQNYKPEDRLPTLKQPVLIVQPHEMLLNETRAAKRDLLPNATYVEIPGITNDVFELAAKDYARIMREWLDK